MADAFNVILMPIYFLYFKKECRADFTIYISPVHLLLEWTSTRHVSLRAFQPQLNHTLTL